ncbi:MAG: FG-GAP-like repeat-containing protein [Limisphaerales bacterium]
MARAADFNNDGRLDFAISDKLTSSGELSGFGLWHNNNKGAFSLWPIAAAYVPAEMAWGDFDNDDDLDLVTSYWDSGVNTRFQLIRNNGTKLFPGRLTAHLGLEDLAFVFFP